MLYNGTIDLGDFLDQWAPDEGPDIYGGYNEQDQAHLVLQVGEITAGVGTLIMRVPDPRKRFKTGEVVLEQVDKLAVAVAFVLKQHGKILTISS